MTQLTTYPVQLEGRLDPGLSRWLWLVKWLLAIPHYIILFFLWLAFGVLSVVAFFAILFTGRYPHSIFDFNVGVLRWSWRVSYYAYGALGTDRYPPFSIAEEPDYPATLHVEYPAQLSRGLVLVKWWLLAIPHYLVVAFFVGGGTYIAWRSDQYETSLAGGGLIGLLVLVAAVVLLFTGRYPNGVFDFVLGMNRWVMRVAAYASLMTDSYPPFRFDAGGPDPGAVAMRQQSTPPQTDPSQADTSQAQPSQAAETGGPPSTPPSRPTDGGWSAGRVVTVVVGSLLMLIGFGLVPAGAATLVIDQTQRDADGFLSTSEGRFSTASYAMSSEPVDIEVDGPDWLVAPDMLGEVRIQAASATDGVPVFVGIGRADDVSAYLAGVEHDEVVELDSYPFAATYQLQEGAAPSTPPGEQDFWVASSEGTGQQSATWAVEDGDWTLVVMNADGSPGVNADLTAGAEAPWLLWIAVSMLVAGSVCLLVGAVLVLLAARPRNAVTSHNG